MVLCKSVFNWCFKLSFFIFLFLFLNLDRLQGFQYQLGDFQLRVGKVVPSHSENLRGIVMEVRNLTSTLVWLIAFISVFLFMLWRALLFHWKLSEFVWYRYNSDKLDFHFEISDMLVFQRFLWMFSSKDNKFKWVIFNDYQIYCNAFECLGLLLFWILILSAKRMLERKMSKIWYFVIS